jgi:hypothetical protein
MQIAMATGQCQIFQYGCALMLAGDDMFHVKGHKTSCCLRQPAVFANLTCPLAYHRPQGTIHQD